MQVPFSAPTRAWFEASFAEATRAQTEGWPPISRGEHTLITAPTGSGKTLAAFLWAIDRVTQLPADAEPGVRVLYVSPLKALAYDVERNLRAPLAGIVNRAAGSGVPLRPVRVDIRTGDTSQKERRLQARKPGDILVTTPESLYLILTSAAREALRTVHTVIVDEIHAMAHSKRGVHLALSLERLAEITGSDPQRIGLSATQRPLDKVGRFLCGPRPVTIVDVAEPPRMDLRIVVPVEDMENPVSHRPAQSAASKPRSGSLLATGGAPRLQTEDLDGPRVQTSIWPEIYPRIIELIRAHATTIVFTNSRLLCERLCNKLNEEAGEELARAHHGSISHHQRKIIEEQLKAGEIPAIVATSSLELGIDMGAVDLVILVESPHSVSSGLQRIGRAGHGVGEVSIGRVFPKYRGDLLEAAVVGKAMAEGDVEPIHIPHNCLDVLAQQLVAMCVHRDREVDDLFDVVRRADPYRDLSRGAFERVLDMLSGRYPSDDFADLRPRLAWDRTKDVVSARKGARMLAIMNAGTIPDRGLFSVHIGIDGPRIGELDEEMVYESRRGDSIVLGASTWRVIDITRDRVLVEPAPGEPGRLPFWRGEGPGRPIEIGRRVGAFTRTLAALPRDEALAWVKRDYNLDDFAAGNLVTYVEEQREATGTVPTDRAITVEAFRDEIGDWRVCILSPFGQRVHAPWSMAIKAMLSARTGFEVHTLYGDEGIVLRFADADDPPPLELLLPEPDEVEDLVLDELRHSALFQGRFRENAGRALLIPRKRPDERTPLWAQRRKAETLLAVAGRFSDFPILLETYRECLQDVFDLPALIELMGKVRSREVRVDQVETATASPFARSLVFRWVASFMYEYDVPLAERRAAALTLDRNLLRQLLGDDQLRTLLDGEVCDALELELQGLADDRRASDANELHDLLRRLGDLTVAEARVRATDDPVPWLQALRDQRRAVPVRVGGEERWVATQDVGRYRDGLGVMSPPGVPLAFLEPVEAAFESLILRFARCRGPFQPGALVARYGLVPDQVATVLQSLVDRDLLVHGEIRPGGTGRDYCHPEVLRTLRRRSLARLREAVAPVDPAALAPFLASWQGVGVKRGGVARLREVVHQLEGLSLPFSALERSILPARVPHYEPRMLDELGATGEVVWVGRGALGSTDGRIALVRREQVPFVISPPERPDFTPLQAALVGHLDTRGASFFTELKIVARDYTDTELLAALWDLAWAGLITNDTFAPLRALSGGTRTKKRGRSRAASFAGGRWSPVDRLIFVEATDTERLHSRASALLERYGLVTREAALHEEVPGGFTAVYQVFRAMEDAGRVRRGYFVDGLGGAQFALPGAVDRLRAYRDGVPDEPPTVLSAVDPANPFGAVVPWPDTTSADHRPRRVAGSLVVLVGGRPALFVDRGGRTVVTFVDTSADHLVQALGAVIGARSELGRRTLRFEKIDGQPARQTPRLDLFQQAGFAADHRGLVSIR